MRPLRTKLLALASATLLAGCQTTGTGVTDPCTTQWRPVTWSTKDTPRTIDEVKGNNARRKGWCER